MGGAIRRVIRPTPLADSFKPAPVTPTTAEVSQSNAANATTPVEEDPLYLRKKKTQAKGRSATILTSSKGVNEDSTLGKKSLLGA